MELLRRVARRQEACPTSAAKDPKDGQPMIDKGNPLLSFTFEVGSARNKRDLEGGIH